MRTLHKLFCLTITSVCVFAACRSRAQNGVQVDWDSLDGFMPASITINAGDEVDFFNTDEFGTDLQLVGDAPESFSTDVPPTPDGISFYYYPYVYNNPGTFMAYDAQFFNTVTITVNAILPLAANITDPSSNAVFIAPATFSITSTPSGGAAPYSDVQFLVGTNDAGDITSSPYTTTVTNLPAGNYVISAIVTDNNFNTATDSIPVIVVPPPSLAAARAGNQLIVSWPTNYYAAYSLYSTTNLQLTNAWTAVAPTPGPAGTNWAVTNPISGPRMFFRLSNP